VADPGERKGVGDGVGFGFGYSRGLVRDPLATRSTSNEAEQVTRRCIAVRIIAHPDAQRVGEFAPLFDEGSDGAVEISRNAPDFRTIEGRTSGPLGSPRITRTPLSIELQHGKLRISQPEATRVEINGELLQGERVLDVDALQLGVVILFGKFLAFVLGYLELVEAPPSAPFMVGDSSAMRVLRREIQRIAEIDVPVLLRGETGVGKELVAAALHARSRRAGAAYVAVNVASVPASLAASELFGHRRGAFSGAVDEHKGYFSQADGGTLFLDEIGDVASDVQAALLRAVESGVIQPLGGKTVKVDVRLIAATDSNLEAAIAKREFREPLLRRFSYEIWVPPLRSRRDDIGLLFIHFLRQMLGAAQSMDRLRSPEGDNEPWIPAAFVAGLALHQWPGNVRELSNVALRFVVENREHNVARISDSLRGLLRSRPPEQPLPWGTPRPRTLLPASSRAERATQLSDAELVAAMQAAKFQRESAAKALGISKSYLYRRLARIPEIRSLADIPAAEVQAALDAAGGDSTLAAEQLRVSDRALRIHLKRTNPSSPHR
jgi:two-component system, NtrC family, nitrogen regulation response regulator GlnG